MHTDRLEMDLVDPVTLDVDPYDVAVLRDPYAFHHVLREAGPVAYLARYGVYATGRHHEAGMVLSDYRRFESAGGLGIQDIRKPGRFRTPSRLIDTDPPEHTGIRGALSRILTPIVVRKWRADFEREAELFVDRAIALREFDGVADFCEAYVMHVFAEAVGIELPRNAVRAIGEMRFNQTGPENGLYHSAMKRAEPYLDWFEEARKRHKMRPGSIGEMLYVAEDEGKLPPDTAANLLLTFVGGGTDSSISGIGTALRQLAENPEQWALARQDPGLMKNALDEALRFDAPFQIVYRTTVGPTSLSGVRLEGGVKIGAFLGAANRDPRQWERPGTFDLRRQTAGVHVAFGVGSHICIGQMIARLESEALLTAFARKVRTLALAGEAIYRPMNQLRTLDRLPLRVTS